MRISKAQKQYSPLLPLFKKPIFELTKAEAKEHFEWYKAHINSRSEYIREKVSGGLRISINDIDYTFDSLLPIWTWFLTIAEIRNVPMDVLAMLRQALGEKKAAFAADFFPDYAKELSIFNQYVMRDIAMYVAKMFVAQHPSLVWSYSRKRTAEMHIPVLGDFVSIHEGRQPFHYGLDPNHVVQVAARNVLDGTQSASDLYNICKQWEAHIPAYTDARE